MCVTPRISALAPQPTTHPIAPLLSPHNCSVMKPSAIHFALSSSFLLLLWFGAVLVARSFGSGGSLQHGLNMAPSGHSCAASSLSRPSNACSRSAQQKGNLSRIESLIANCNNIQRRPLTEACCFGLLSISCSLITLVTNSHNPFGAVHRQFLASRFTPFVRPSA